MPKSRCPFCGARGVKIADRPVIDGVTFRFDYCGHCGRNSPRMDLTPADQPPPGSRVLMMPDPEDR